MSTRRDFLRAAGAAVLIPHAAPARPRPFSDFDAPARQMLSTLSVDEKVGQMTQPDQTYLKSIDDIETYHLGSLLSGGDSDPKSGNDPDSWTALYERYQKRAVEARPHIPLLYGIDSVHGNSNVIGAVIFPHNIGLGCTRNEKLVEEIGRLTASETRAIGVNWAFSPCVTVPQDIRWGRTYEGFSEDPAVVAPLGAAATRGLQWNDLANPHSVLACVKHFAGDGGTTFSTGMPRGKGGDRYPLDRGDTRGDEEALFRLHIAGYIPSIAAGAGSIMPSYSSWNGEKCSGSRRLLTDILKGRLGFQGFLISDYNALGELPGKYKEQIAQSINAGMDMVMVPDRYQEFIRLLKENVAEGKVPQSRIDDAVLRILRVKYAMGLMEAGANLMAVADDRKAFGSAAHRAIARQAARESVVVLKNEKRALPLVGKAGRIHVGGKNMNDIGNQCGGWTITWQGKSGATTKGTTILTALREMAGTVSSSVDGSGAEGAKVGVAVIGEQPYAEFQGDRTDLKLSREDVAVVKNLKSAGIPVVAVIVSGRPLVIDEILSDADAIVAAWWPGSEGQGVVDVLLGKHAPKGKLSFTWPAAASTSFRRGDPGYKALFPFGHGLTKL
jgi:beta-glucosidase